MMKVCYSEMDTPAGLSCRLEADGHAGYAPAGRAFGSYPKCHRFKSSYAPRGALGVQHRLIGHFQRQPRLV